MESNREALPNIIKNFIEEDDVSIYTHPKPREKGRCTAILGDLHGNAIKLLYFLIREGILELDTEPKNYPEHLRDKITGNKEDLYQELVNIYGKDPDVSNNSIAQVLDRIDNYTASRFDTKKNYFANVIKQLESEDLDFFKTIILKAKITNKRKIILLGDEFCDRGSNDYFTLKILEKLKKESVPYDILLSNHGAEFYSVFQNVKASCANEQTNKYAVNFHKATRFIFTSTVLIPIDDSTLSLQNLGALIKRKLITADEVANLINHCCTSNLKLLNYVETEDGRLGICSHAPIGFETIQGLANAFGLKDSFKPDDTKKIKKTIDQINIKFQFLLSNHFNLKAALEISSKIPATASAAKSILDIANLLKVQKSFPHLPDKKIDLAKFIFYFHKCIWNRERETLTRNAPFIFWINGHDIPVNFIHPSEFCLDSDCGRDSSPRQVIGEILEKYELELRNDLNNIDINMVSKHSTLSNKFYSLINQICESAEKCLDSLPFEASGQIKKLQDLVAKNPTRLEQADIALLKQLAHAKFFVLADALATGDISPSFLNDNQKGTYVVFNINEVPALNLEVNPVTRTKRKLSYLWDETSKTTQNGDIPFKRANSKRCC